MIRTTIGFAGLCALFIACGGTERQGGFDPKTNEQPNTPNNPGGPLGDGNNPPPEDGGDECQKMDILFVVDDSGSMKEEQANLAHNFPKFVAKIDSFKTKSGAALDWRLAVTTTGRDLNYKVAPAPGFPEIPMSEKGDNGVFRRTPSCGVTEKWVDKTTPKPAEAFACLAQVGTGGPSLEMPLYAAELALVDRVADGTNKDFLRPDALLAIVILTDEDDCSRKGDNFSIANDQCNLSTPDVVPTMDFKKTFDGVAKGEGRWATAVIAGDKECTSSFGSAIQARRLRQFTALAGGKGVFASICDGDLTTALETALETFDAACKSLPGVQ